VQRMALISLSAATSGQPTPKAVAAAAVVLRKHAQWSLRLLAVQVLERTPAGPPRTEAVNALDQAARTDKFAIVRDAALRALLPLDPVRAKATAAAIAPTEAEPHVQEAAKRIAAGTAP
jgi:cellulose synthase operon protein C